MGITILACFRGRRRLADPVCADSGRGDDLAACSRCIIPRVAGHVAALHALPEVATREEEHTPLFVQLAASRIQQGDSQLAVGALLLHDALDG